MEFEVNDVKQDYAMKLGEGGEAFFVFETSDEIPEALQTSPLVSPAISPNDVPADTAGSEGLQEPDFLELTTQEQKARPGIRRELTRTTDMPVLSAERRSHSDVGNLSPLSMSPARPISGDWAGSSLPAGPFLDRSASEDVVPQYSRIRSSTFSDSQRPDFPSQSSAPSRPSAMDLELQSAQGRCNSPPPLPTKEAVDRAKSLSKKLSGSNIPTQISDSGDLMLDMTGYKSSEDEALRAEVIARKILSEELEGNYDIGALIGADERGNLWIYSSEEAKEAAGRRAGLQNLSLPAGGALNSDAASDPGYQSDGDRSTTATDVTGAHQRTDSETAGGLVTPPQTPPDATGAADSTRNYAKTLRLTSDQLKALNLRYGANSMSFSVNRATCTAYMYYWKYEVPIVISDIDGTITK